MAKLVLEDNHMCYVCGSKNEHGFHLKFEHPQKGLLKASVVFKDYHQGFKGMVHGGLLATLLDEMMVNLAWVEGLPAVTGEMTIRLQKPVKTGQKLHLEGYLDHTGRRLLKTRALAKDETGQVLATASGTCVRIKNEVE